MILFFYGLQLAGMQKLAAAAREALREHHHVIVTLRD